VVDIYKNSTKSFCTIVHYSKWKKQTKSLGKKRKKTKEEEEPKLLKDATNILDIFIKSKETSDIVVTAPCLLL